MLERLFSFKATIPNKNGTLLVRVFYNFVNLQIIAFEGEAIGIGHETDDHPTLSGSKIVLP